LTEKEKVIFEIQQKLRNIYKGQGDDPAIIPDGIFSDETKRAVTDFQKSQNLTRTGKVDFATFEALKTENERVLFRESLPVQVMRIRNEDFPLSYGDENEFVEKLKIMLNLVADRHKNFSSLERNSIFDRDTEEQVRRWQAVTFTRETGVVDKETWNSLASYYLL